MREYSSLLLKILCGALAALVLYEVVQMGKRWKPLGNTRIPALPALAMESTNATKGMVKPPANAPSTNAPSTNAPSTNAPSTNAPSTNAPSTNAPSTNAPSTNAPSTNAPSTNAPSTNVPSTVSRPNPRAGPVVKGVDLPPTIRPRVDRITQSEILAPFMRPLPAALLGIGGREALLRAASGQTGNLKEGEEMGGLKLLRIGTNRVLVLENNQTNELMIFSGFGGPTLLPKTNANSP